MTKQSEFFEKYAPNGTEELDEIILDFEELGFSTLQEIYDFLQKVTQLINPIHPMKSHEYLEWLKSDLARRA